MKDTVKVLDYYVKIEQNKELDLENEYSSANTYNSLELTEEEL